MLRTEKRKIGVVIFAANLLIIIGFSNYGCNISFCDELPEFNRSVLEVMRQPLEDRCITISRAKYSVQYPCSFMFVASMNPCRRCRTPRHAPRR